MAPSSFELALAERLLPDLKETLGAAAFAAEEAAGRGLSLEDVPAEATRSHAGT